MFDTFFFSKHLEDDETVSAIMHPHWLFGVRALLWPTVCMLLGWGIFSLFPTNGMLLAVGMWSLFVLAWWVQNFLDYYLDVWIVTDQGIVDLQWEGWFHRQSTRILYSDLQGVSYEIKGVAGTVFGYGTLSIEKISTGATVSVDNVPQPRIMETLILQNMEKYLHAKNLKNAKHVQELLADFVAQKFQENTIPKKEQTSPRKPMISRKI